MSDNIYCRMSKITADISRVAKNLEVGYGKSKYKAVGEADVLASVKPLEAQYGVYSYPVSREIIDSGVLTTKGYDGNEKNQMYMRIKTVYRFLCIDNPESYLDIESFADGVDSQDKACGKAMTYADKYALMKAYKIITGDDPDQNMSEELKAKKRMQTAYPSRVEMEKFISENYDAENLKKILEYYKAETLGDLKLEEVIVAYNRKKR